MNRSHFNKDACFHCPGTLGNSPCRSLLAPMGGRSVPVSFIGGGRTSALLFHWSTRRARPRRLFPVFLTFSLGNHFLRTSTAIFILKSFSKSCLAHVNAASVAFALKTASSAACVHTEPPAIGSEQHRGCASVHGDPVNSDSVRAQCSDHRVSFPLLAHDNPYTESVVIVHVHALNGVSMCGLEEQ